jgi:photosystem II stability/assembly factor-like uncharacterized protein
MRYIYGPRELDRITISAFQRHRFHPRAQFLCLRFVTTQRNLLQSQSRASTPTTSFLSGVIAAFVILLLACKPDPHPQEVQVDRISTAYTKDLLDICFINNNVGIIAGEFDFSASRKSTLLRTNDGGNTWTVDLLNIKNLKVEGITASGGRVFISATDLVRGKQIIYQSIDEGRNWQLFNEEMTYLPQFYDMENGLSLFGQRILKTSNGGVGWDSVFNVNLMTPPFIQLAGQSAFVGAGSLHDNFMAGILLKSVDLGTTWTQLAWNDAGVSNMHFVDADYGFVISFSGEIFKTEDGGNSFNMVHSGISTSSPGCFFISSSEGFYSNRNEIFWTATGGQEWDLVFADETVSMNNKIVYASNGFIVGKSGLILRITKR